MNYRIVADSSSNILSMDNPHYYSVPMKVRADREYIDDAQLDLAAMVEDLRNHKGKSGSACPSVGEYLEAFGDADVVFATTISKNLSGSYYFVQNGKEMPRHEMNFRTMKVGKLKKDFKRFLVDPGLLNVKTLTWWLPKNTARSFKRLGFNWVGITVAKAKNKTFYSGNNPKTDEDYYDLLIQDSKRPGGKLFYKTFITSSGPNSWKWTKTDPEPRAKDWFGKHPLNQYNYPALCPSYRGKYFQEWVQRLIEAVPLQNTGSRGWDSTLNCGRRMSGKKSVSAKDV